MTVSSNPALRRIALLGAPVEVGASQRGPLMGAAALRTAGLVAVLESLGFGVEDHGDLSPADLHPIDDVAPPNTKHYREIGAWIRALSARAHALAHSGAIPLFLGGDHS